MYLSLFLPVLAVLRATHVTAAPLPDPDDLELSPRGGSITFEGCTTGEEKLINIYLKDMQKLAKAGADATETPPGKESAVYKAWWGTQATAPGLINERLNSRYEKMSVFLKNPRKDVIFNCNKSLGCTGTSPAATSTNTTRIYLCAGSFWHMPMRSLANVAPPVQKCTDIGLYRGTAAVLLHELTHALFFTADEEQDGKGLGSGYGHANGLELAAANPSAARNNADSYAMFATAAYFGLDKFETNPNQICGNVRR